MGNETHPVYDAVNKRTLWVVSELYFPEETSTGYYLTRIAEGLTGSFNVKVLCGQPNYSQRGSRAPNHEILNDAEIFRARATTLNKNIIFFRLINIVTLSLTICFQSLFRFRAGDSILVVTTPPSLPFIAAFSALIRGASYTLLIHDNYPEILIAAGKIRDTSAIARSLNFFNRWLYKHASKIIVVGRDMKELLESKTQGLDIPIAIIQNWAELETLRPESRSDNQLLIDLGLTDRFIFLYAGNMGYPNDIESIVSCAAKLKLNPNIHFIFLGAGVKEPWLNKAVTARNLTNCTILKPRPRAEQIVFLNACDVAVVSLVPRMKGVSMPSRTYNILAAGKPILAITDEESELSKIIEEDRVGWRVSPGDPASLLAAIREIYAYRDKIKVMGLNARKAALEKYSVDRAIDNYRRELS